MPTSQAEAAPPGGLRSLDRALVRSLLRLRGDPPIGVILPDGSEVRGAAAEPVARVRLRDRGVLRELLRNPDLALGEAYADGRIDVEGDLARLVEEAFRSHGRAPRLGRAAARLLGARPRRNTRSRARDHIHRHYDLGNDFYRLWLDENLVYTCAYFPTPETGLEEAQLAKMEHVCRKLVLRPGERVVEAGCGWGSLALYMAERHGVRVRAYNISEEQILYAREQARRRGLDRRVEFVLDDYRAIEGRYDAFVSVGMLEHVGPAHYRTLGRVIHRSLEPHGRGLLHSIGRSRPQPMNPWIERYIFPGAYIPALREMLEVLEPFELTVLDVENLRPHYARTLEHWLDRFEKVADEVRRRFDDRFVRMWRLYLASSIASFRTGSCQLYQVLFARPSSSHLPWTRAHLYGSEAGPAAAEPV